VSRRQELDREQELATTIQAAKARLFALLLPNEQKTSARTGSEHPLTFEDHAASVPRAAGALAEFQQAVNALWLFAIERELPDKLAHAWRKKHQSYAWLPYEHISAEALMALRYAIIHFIPGKGASLETFAGRGVHQAVELPQKEARRIGPGSYRVSLDALNNASAPDHSSQYIRDRAGERESRRRLQTYDPWPLINAALDGEVTEDDL
jgi:hypothetical protein